MPTSLSIRGRDLDRSFNQIVYPKRIVDLSSSLPNYQKFFVFNRNYNAKWSIFKALSFDYSARVVAIVDEPDGDINTDSLKQVVKNNLKQGGRTKTLNRPWHSTIRGSHSIKIPIINWLGADYRYNWL